MRFATVLALAATVLSTSALAGERNAATASQDYITAYAGAFNIMQDGVVPVQFGAEYRFAEWDFGVRPTLGVNVDTKGAVYGYGGINWEIALGNSGFILIPNFMAGAYHSGDSRDLGGAIEFRSGIELDYQMENAHRVGIAFNHISNASIYDKNPGAEALLITYSLPVSSVFGK